MVALYQLVLAEEQLTLLVVALLDVGESVLDASHPIGRYVENPCGLRRVHHLGRVLPLNPGDDVGDELFVGHRPIGKVEHLEHS